MMMSFQFWLDGFIRLSGVLFGQQVIQWNPMLHSKMNGHLEHVTFRISIKQTPFGIAALTLDNLEKLFPARRSPSGHYEGS
jgi:hypothetical protein